MKLDTPEFHSLFTPELVALVSMFRQHGYEIRIAGGAVRDLLMKIKPKDLDFATTATPDQMKEMFTAENVRLINTKGERHGTITPRINDKENFEVTTLRIDVCTDGRHADVEFTTDWKLDANRRDLTINSMFLGLDGVVYDYFHGYDDLQDRRVAFVGDAATRIREDFLRILRYFRFYGRIAKDPHKHEEKTLEAIQDNADGLKKISGERIWSELQKILEGNFAGELVKEMLKLDLGRYMGLPETPNIAEFERVWQNLKNLKYNAVTLLAALFGNQEEVITFHTRVKLSAYERDLLLFIVAHRENKPSTKPIRPYQLLVIGSKWKASEAQAWVAELLRYRGDPELLRQFEQWQPPKFPVNGHMLKEHGVPGGKLLGPVLQRLKEYWVEHDFQVDSEEILKQIPSVMCDLGISTKR
ncbi:CCA tRNA nucleotidyltransferase 1, mitochondrial isoform X2 [Bacillus rossius redtenbacheri]